MNIIVFGATGRWNVDRNRSCGGWSQGTAVVRDDARAGALPDDVAVRVANATDIASVKRAMADHDLAITAPRPPQAQEGEPVRLTRSILEAAVSLNPRLIVAGGAARQHAVGYLDLYQPRRDADAGHAQRQVAARNQYSDRG